MKGRSLAHSFLQHRYPPIETIGAALKGNSRTWCRSEGPVAARQNDDLHFR